MSTNKRLALIKREIEREDNQNDDLIDQDLNHTELSHDDLSNPNYSDDSQAPGADTIKLIESEEARQLRKKLEASLTKKFEEESGVIVPGLYNTKLLGTSPTGDRASRSHMDQSENDSKVNPDSSSQQQYANNTEFGIQKRPSLNTNAIISLFPNTDRESNLNDIHLRNGKNVYSTPKDDLDSESDSFQSATNTTTLPFIKNSVPTPNITLTTASNKVMNLQRHQQQSQENRHHKQSQQNLDPLDILIKDRVTNMHKKTTAAFATASMMMKHRAAPSTVDVIRSQVAAKVMKNSIALGGKSLNFGAGQANRSGFNKQLQTGHGAKFGVKSTLSTNWQNNHNVNLDITRSISGPGPGLQDHKVLVAPSTGLRVDRSAFLVKSLMLGSSNLIKPRTSVPGPSKTSTEQAITRSKTNSKQKYLESDSSESKYTDRIQRSPRSPRNIVAVESDSHQKLSKTHQSSSASSKVSKASKVSVANDGPGQLSKQTLLEIDHLNVSSTVKKQDSVVARKVSSLADNFEVQDSDDSNQSNVSNFGKSLKQKMNDRRRESSDSESGTEKVVTDDDMKHDQDLDSDVTQKDNLDSEIDSDGPDSDTQQIFNELVTPTSNLDVTLIQNKSLGKLTLTIMIFFNVCGGPWGSEQIFSCLGPLPGILSLMFIAVFWGWPQCELTAELGCAFPVNGGVSIWINEAFGSFWGFQASYWSWVSSLVCSSNNCVLLVDGCRVYFPEYFDSWGEEYGEEVKESRLMYLKVVIIWLCAIPNLLSTDRTSDILESIGTYQFFPIGMFVICVLVKQLVWPFILSPVVDVVSVVISGNSILQQDDLVIQGRDVNGVDNLATGIILPFSNETTITSNSNLLQPSYNSTLSSAPNSANDDSSYYPLSLFLQHDITQQQTHDPEDEDTSLLKKLGQLLRFSYWSMTGWDNVSAMAGEIQEPEVNLPPALMNACVLSFFQYSLVLSSLLLVDPFGWREWRDQDFMRIAKEFLLGKQEDQVQVDKREDIDSGNGIDGYESEDENHSTITNLLNKDSDSDSSFPSFFSLSSTLSNLFPSLSTLYYLFITILAMSVNFTGNIGLYLTELLCCSHQLCGLTEAGVLPSFNFNEGSRFFVLNNFNLSWLHPVYKTPWVAIFVHTMLATLLVTLPFEELLLFDNTFNSLPDLLGILGFLHFRKSRPIGNSLEQHGDAYMHRPYVMPDWMYKYIIYPIHLPIVITILMLCFFESYKTFMISVVAIGFGFVLGFLQTKFGGLRESINGASGGLSRPLTPNVSSNDLVNESESSSANSSSNHNINSEVTVRARNLKSLKVNEVATTQNDKQGEVKKVK